MNKILILLVKYSVLYLAFVLLSGCAVTPLNPPNGTISGIPATKSKVILKNEQIIKTGKLQYVFPAGEYLPAYEDSIGIYYSSPSPIIYKENFLGFDLSDKPMIGGIYLDRASPQSAKVYFINPDNGGGELYRLTAAGRPSKPTLPPVAFQFQLVK